MTRDYGLGMEDKRAVKVLLAESAIAHMFIKIDDTPYSNTLHVEADDTLLSHGATVIRDVVEAVVSRDRTVNLSLHSIGKLDSRELAAVKAFLNRWFTRTMD